MAELTLLDLQRDIHALQKQVAVLTERVSGHAQLTEQRISSIIETVRVATDTTAKAAQIAYDVAQQALGQADTALESRFETLEDLARRQAR
jgi:hypothetical protein